MVATLTEAWESTHLGWQQTNLKIITKAAKMVPLVHNRAQLRVHNTKQIQRDRNLPVRIIVCKARQRGVSTYEEADMFEDINRKPNRHGCVVSADLDSTSKVFGMCKVFQEEMPPGVRRPTKHSNRKEISYAAPHRSSILCQTVGKEVIGRGGTTQRVHATEVAFWARAEDKLYGLLQEVPLLPDTCVVLESTSFGTTGEFHDRYMTAVDRLRRDITDINGYLPVFLSWQDDPEYQMVLPKGVTIKPERDHEIFGNEQWLIDAYQCTPEQLYWRRYKIENEFKKDLSRFMQEYPATAKESFQGTGRMVFLPSKVDHLETRCRPPIANIEFYDDNGTVRYREVLRTQNCWSIWHWPERNHQYCLFGDVAEGKISDKDNPRSDSDRSVAIVLDRTAYTIPCVYYGRPDTVKFGDQMVLAARFFRHAWATPEMNSIGQSVLDAFKRANYHNIYYRERGEDTDSSEDSDYLGWRTTTLTRKPMIADLVDIVHEDHCDLGIFDIRIINEMRHFIVNKEGKEEADTGEHDDCVMALAGVIQLHKRCLMVTDEKDEADAFGDTSKQQYNAGEVAGGFDTELDDEDDELKGSDEEFAEYDTDEYDDLR